MRLTAATLPVRKASSRLGIDPALVVLMCSGARKPSISFSVVKCEPLFGVTAISLSLSCSGSYALESPATTMANDDMEAPSATIFRLRRPSLSASTARFMIPHSHMRN